MNRMMKLFLSISLTTALLLSFVSLPASATPPGNIVEPNSLPVKPVLLTSPDKVERY